MNKSSELIKNHDKVVRLQAKFENLQKRESKLLSDFERDFSDLKSFRHRIVDLKINNYDRFIDLEVFILKIFIPIISISFAAGTNILGINVSALKFLSFVVILSDIFALIITFSIRSYTVSSEEGRFKGDLDSLKNRTNDTIETLEIMSSGLKKDITRVLDNEPNMT